jgi:hypothetical protein
LVVTGWMSGISWFSGRLTARQHDGGEHGGQDGNGGGQEGEQYRGSVDR